MKRHKTIWLLVQLGMLSVSILIFTPVITPKGKFTPELFNLPYTLWTGFFVYLVMVALSLVGIFVHSKIYKESND
ncbi:MAG: hypothetical protein ABFS28_07120 [Bacteroidota bacterium]